MSEYYVKVFADSFDNARLTFIEKFMKIYMNNETDYLWQREAKDFDEKNWVKGEALTIYQN